MISLHISTEDFNQERLLEILEKKYDKIEMPSHQF